MGELRGAFWGISTRKPGVLAPVDEVALVPCFDVAGWDALDMSVGPRLVHAGEQALAPAMRRPIFGDVLGNEVNREIGVGVAVRIGDDGVGEDWIEDRVPVPHLDRAADDVFA